MVAISYLYDTIPNASRQRIDQEIPFSSWQKQSLAQLLTPIHTSRFHAHYSALPTGRLPGGPLKREVLRNTLLLIAEALRAGGARHRLDSEEQAELQVLSNPSGPKTRSSYLQLALYICSSIKYDLITARAIN